MIEGAIIGFLAGFIPASFGAYKDTKWEPFSFKKFIRSPILAMFGGLIGIYIYRSHPLELIAIFSLFIERITVEFWKGVIRRKKPSKFNSKERDTGWLRGGA